MKYPMFAIRDNLTRFLSPMIDDNEPSAIRNFKYWLHNNGLSDYSPNDFDFYRVGTFDSESGRIDPADPVEFIISGASAYNS